MSQNGENAYLVVKNPRAYRALRWALASANQGSLHSCDFAAGIWQKGPKFSVWAPLYKKAGYDPVDPQRFILMASLPFKKHQFKYKEQSVTKIYTALILNF